jgi:hypothetical protein
MTFGALMTQEQDSSSDEPDDSESLQDLADAVRARRHTRDEETLSAGWRVVIMLMRLWAGLLFGVGLIICVGVMISLGLGAPAFQVESGPGHLGVHGWGLEQSSL